MNTKLETDTINIKNLIVEEPTNTPIELDLEKMLQEEDWEDIKERFEQTIVTNRERLGTIFRNIYFAAELKLIAPQRLSILNVDQYLEMAQEELRSLNFPNSILAFYFASEAKQLYGKDKLDINISETDKDKWRHEIEDHKGTINGYINSILTFRILQPQESVESYVSEDGWKKIKTAIESKEGSAFLHNIAFFSVVARLLYPNRFSELNINQGDLRSIYENILQAKERKNWDLFAELAWCLKILTADDVRVTDDGIKLINQPKPSKPLSVAEALPERRKF